MMIFMGEGLFDFIDSRTVVRLESFCLGDLSYHQGINIEIDAITKRKSITITVIDKTGHRNRIITRPKPFQGLLMSLRQVDF